MASGAQTGATRLDLTGHTVKPPHTSRTVSRGLAKHFDHVWIWVVIESEVKPIVPPSIEVRIHFNFEERGTKDAV